MLTHFFLSSFGSVFSTILYTNFLIILFLLLPVLSFNNYTPQRVNSGLNFSKGPQKLMYFYKL